MVLIGGLVGAVVSVVEVAVFGAVTTYFSGVGLGHAISEPPGSLSAALFGAFWFLMFGGLPAVAIGFLNGAIVGAVLRGRKPPDHQGAA
jgi:hypothetical protein